MQPVCDVGRASATVQRSELILSVEAIDRSTKLCVEVQLKNMPLSELETWGFACEKRSSGGYGNEGAWLVMQHTV